MNGRVARLIEKQFGLRVQFDCSLKPYTTFAIGGKAAALLVVETAEELRWLLSCIEENELAWQVIGKGSNLLVNDKGFDGLVLMLGASFKRITISADDGVIEAGAGVSLTKLIKWCQRRGLCCIESLFGVPGTAGGAAVMNAGAFDGEIGQVLAGIELIDKGGPRYLGKDSLTVSYRCLDSWKPFRGKAVMTKVFLRSRPGDAGEIARRCRELAAWRKEKQPLGQPNAGSFFKNPPGESAGRLIDDAGLKGISVGGAKVSEKHANFLVNTGSATCDDVLQLMKLVQAEVQQFSGIVLEPEVQFI